MKPLPATDNSDDDLTGERELLEGFEGTSVHEKLADGAERWGERGAAHECTTKQRQRRRACRAGVQRCKARRLAPRSTRPAALLHLARRAAPATASPSSPHTHDTPPPCLHTTPHQRPHPTCARWRAADFFDRFEDDFDEDDMALP